MTTIDNLHLGIIAKLEILINVCQQIIAVENIKACVKLAVEKLHAQLNNEFNSYSLGGIDILLSYYMLRNSAATDAQLTDVFNKFHSYVILNNVIGNLETAHSQVKKLLSKVTVADKKTQQAITHQLDEYMLIAFDQTITIVQYEKCAVCHQNMTTDANTSQLICNKCGHIETLYGTVFDDDQFFFQEGQRTKHGSYDSTKHGKAWIDKIQALEQIDVTEVTTEIKRRIANDKILKHNLTCSMIRNYLKEMKCTRYNEHVSLIRKQVTGIAPPELTEQELKKIHTYFDRVIHIFNRNKAEDKPNSPYHPYFLYKIIDCVLDAGGLSDSARVAAETRKREILSCIHLQSSSTLRANDIKWKQICQEIPEFTYTPTMRND